MSGLSTPPAAPAGSDIKPMNGVAAALWVVGTHMVFLWLAMTIIAIREAASRDVFSQVICQVAAYSLGLFLLLRVHAPRLSIRRFLALQPAGRGFTALAVLLGGAISLPASLLLYEIERRFPPPPREFDIVTAFFDAPVVERWLIALSVVILGPLLEEILFRGALFRPLLRRYKPWQVVGLTAVLFAAIHLDLHRLAPILLVGLVLGYARLASGSLVPAIVLHCSFNAVPFIGLFAADSAAAAQAEDDVPLGLTLAAGAVCVGALWAMRYRYLKQLREAQPKPSRAAAGAAQAEDSPPPDADAADGLPPGLTSRMAPPDLRPPAEPSASPPAAEPPTSPPAEGRASPPAEPSASRADGSTEPDDPS